MATQQIRNFQSGKSSFIGKDPFDGLLKRAFNVQNVETNLQKEYLKRINAIDQENPNALVGKNPEFIAYALRYGSKLPQNKPINSIDVLDFIQKELKQNISSTTFTIIRYILWLREMEGQSILNDIVPSEWTEYVNDTKKLIARTKYQFEDSDDLEI